MPGDRRLAYRERPQEECDARFQVRDVGIGETHASVGVKAMGKKLLLLEPMVHVPPRPSSA